jgi:hypothetical protein
MEPIDEGPGRSPPSAQRQLLPRLVQLITDVDPDAGVMLQGSVAAGRECTASDIDLTVILPEMPVRWNLLITPGNQWGMIRTRVDASPIPIDINWVIEQQLQDSFRTHGCSDWFIFAGGEILSDRAGAAARCQAVAQAFFAANPRVLREWEQQQRAVIQHKLDPRIRLRFPSWGEFSRHLATLNR